ncbi:MAG: T9SS C-terminal target domain-containing protein [Planctomycetes bacterium]|nr:T9SS C-terminal target domain-containing protein [Planctomycetota bacterium]
MKCIYSLRIVLARKICLISLIGIGSLSSAPAAPPPSSFGVWDRGDTFDPQEYPFLKGFSFNQPWAEVERQPGVFDWSGLDQAVEKACRRKKYLYVSLGVGPEAPEWIYSHGVPKVETDDKKHRGKWTAYPYYLAPEYRTYFQRFITEFGKHIRRYPREEQERIAFIQVKTGCTGDETPYKGQAIDIQYDLPRSAPAWRDFRLEAFALFVKIFQGSSDQPQIDLLFNAVGPVIGSDEDPIEARDGFLKEWAWVTNHVQGSFGIKNGALSRGHHLVGERSLYDQWTPYLIAPKGLTLFRRSEMDQTWQKPWYQLNVPLNFYWGAVNALHGGQSVWDVTQSAMEASKEQGFDYSFYFFNRYAGQIQPETATDAFCALHQGLDAADTKAYPEPVFGPAERRNVDRMLKICAAYSQYGAAVDDEEALLLDQVRQRDTQTGFNDVGWDIWPDNYGRFLYQIDADATSVPRWRVGGPITKTSSIYSRFARGFEHASGKDALNFKLHDGFSQDAKPKVMSITVVWYDGTEGSTWKLAYDAGHAGMKTALTVTGKGDKQWHHETVTLNDAVFRHGGIKGSDLALVNTDAKDDIFSLIEVHRGEPELPALRPPTEVRAFPGYGRGTKYGPDGKGDNKKKRDRKKKNADGESR